MSDELLSIEGLEVSSFYGGHERGACLQFTINPMKFAKLTANDVDRLIITLRKWRSALLEQRKEIDYVRPLPYDRYKS